MCTGKRSWLPIVVAVAVRCGEPPRIAAAADASCGDARGGRSPESPRRSDSSDVHGAVLGRALAVVGSSGGAAVGAPGEGRLSSCALMRRISSARSIVSEGP